MKKSNKISQLKCNMCINLYFSNYKILQEIVAQLQNLFYKLKALEFKDGNLRMATGQGWIVIPLAHPYR